MKQLGLFIFLLLNTAVYGRMPVINTMQASITLVLPATPAGTPVYLSLYRNGICKEAPDTQYTAQIKRNSCTFAIQLPADYCYFSIHQQTTSKGTPVYLFADYLVQQNDSVTILLQPTAKEENDTQIGFTYYAPLQQLHKYKVTFAGPGAVKYSCRYRADQLLQQAGGSLLSVDTNGLFSRNQHADSALATVHRYLLTCKSLIPTAIYTQILTDIAAMLECERLYFYQISAASWHSYTGFFNKALSSYQIIRKKTDQYCSNNRQKTISPWYSHWQAMYYSQVYNNRYNAGTYKPPLLSRTIQQIKQQYKEQLADQIIAFYIPASSKIAQPAAIRQITQHMKNAYCLQLVNRFMQTSTGFTARDFQLADTTGNLISLHRFRGKTVFIDFWFIGCSACSKYYKEILAPTEEKYRTDSNVVFISINIDSRADWLKEINSGNYTSPWCVNLNTGENGLTHPVIKDYDVTVYPRPYLISKTGKIITSKSSDLRFKGISGLTTFIEKAKATQQ